MSDSSRKRDNAAVRGVESADASTTPTLPQGGWAPLRDEPAGCVVTDSPLSRRSGHGVSAARIVPAKITDPAEQRAAIRRATRRVRTKVKIDFVRAVRGG